MPGERRRDRAALARAVEFTNSIGILAILAPFSGGESVEFLPGVLVSEGRLLVDPGRVLGYDGVFHEAGHLAVLPGCIRRYAWGDIAQSTGPHAAAYMDTHPFIVGEEGAEDPVFRALLQSGEDEAAAWAYAAQVACELRPRSHFMMMEETDWRDATRAEVAAELLNLATGNHLGVHGLQAAGMTKARGGYPKMLRWAQP